VEHLQHFGLNDDPFRHDPIERYQLDVPSQHDALLRVDRGVRQARCLVVVSGGVGAGKSTILRKLYEELEEEVFEASMMLVLRGRVDADWLLRRFAVQLGVEEPPTEREALVGQIYERLAIIREDGRHAVLIIDGADALAVPETLAELFALVKLEYEDRRLLTVVLAGSHKLTEVIDADAALVQQIEVRVELEKFSREESARYLGGRVEVAGGAARILLPGAVAALHELSDGCPGRLNTLADNAFFESYLAGRSEVAKSDVERDGLVDLDSELEAVFEPEFPGPERQGALMDLEAPAAAASPPQQPRTVTDPAEIQLDVLDAPPKDEVDDLFMELLDD
jgi:type II secretory pathway predicted ATPase ExeA